LQQPIFYLGPFQGITDVHYRRLFQLYFGGVEKLFTPFFTGIDTPKSKSLQTPELNIQLSNPDYTIPQLLSKNADELVRFATQCDHLGYHEVNWNLGCPYPRVAKKMRGSGLLPYPDIIDQALDNYFSSCSVRLSIKCRLGLNTDDEFDLLIPVFNRYPITELIVHARTGLQMYKGDVHIDKLRDSIPMIKHSVVYNGDVFNNVSFENFKAILPEVSAMMLGRGVLSDPYLATDLAGKTINRDRTEHLKNFLTELFLTRIHSGSPGYTGIGRMKELWIYLKWSFDDPIQVWRLVRKTGNVQEYMDAVNMVFDRFSFTGQGYGKVLEDTID
jgi:tRNA-dihydrouridine synthase B